MAVAFTIYAAVYLLLCIRWWHIVPDIVSSKDGPFEILRWRAQAIAVALGWPLLFGAASVMACWKVAARGEMPE